MYALKDKKIIVTDRHSSYSVASFIDNGALSHKTIRMITVNIACSARFESNDKRNTELNSTQLDPV